MNNKKRWRAAILGLALLVSGMPVTATEMPEVSETSKESRISEGSELSEGSGLSDSTASIEGGSLSEEGSVSENGTYSENGASSESNESLRDAVDASETVVTEDVDTVASAPLLNGETSHTAKDGTSTYIGDDGTVYDEYTDIPCETPCTWTYVCANCGQKVNQEIYKEHYFYMDRCLTYITEDGVVYSSWEWNDIPYGTKYWERQTCLICGKTFLVSEELEKTHDLNELHDQDVKYVMTEDGVKYDGWWEVPCGVGYRTYIECHESGQTYISDISYESHTIQGDCSAYYDEYGNKYANDAYDEIPCEVTFYALYQCGKCGEWYKEYFRKEHSFVNVKYVTDEGVEYLFEDDIPCGEGYSMTATCENCGENVEEWEYKDHDSNYKTIIAEDGKQYGTVEEVPCGIYYTVSFACQSCHEKFEITDYNDHTNHKGSNYTDYLTYFIDEDGTIYKDYSDLPDCQNIIIANVCAVCGSVYYDEMETHEWVTYDDKNYYCQKCGMSEDDSYLIDQTGFFFVTPKAVSAEGDQVILEAYFNIAEDFYDLSIQWQYSTDKGSTWNDCADGIDSEIYIFTMKAGYDGRLYRCVATYDGNKIVSDSIPVSQKKNLVITTQPANVTAAIGSKFILSVEATGTDLTYLWQYSKDNGKSWTDTTQKSSVYATSASNTMNGRMYRCVVTDAFGNSITSGAATLTLTQADSTAGTSYKVTASSLTVRSGPSTSYSALGALSKGTVVKVLEINSSNWGKIFYNGQYGWISMKYCAKQTTPATTTEKATTTTTERPTTTTTEKSTTTTTERTTTTTTEKATTTTTESTATTTGEGIISGTVYKITASSLTVRSGASTSYSAIGYLSNGTTVTVLEISSNNWGKINYNGKTGWISMKYCSKQSTPVTTTEKATTTTTKKATTTTTEKATTTTTEKPKATTTEKATTTTTEQSTASTTAPTTTEKTTTTTTENTTTTTGAAASGTVYKVTASSLTVRSGASTSYSALGYLSNGTMVTVLEISSNNWGKINYNGKTGWICMKYCAKQSAPVTTTEKKTTATTESKKESSTTTTTETVKTTTASSTSGTVYKITASSLTVRSGASTSYSVLGYLSNGTKVTVIEISPNNWGKINYNGKTGWISMKYCSKQ